MMTINKFALMPASGQKSFYNKAVVTVTDAGVFLRSYDTVVAAVINGAPVRLWNGYSVTTLKHVNAFFTAYKLPTVSKKEWSAMPVVILNDAELLGFMCA